LPPFHSNADAKGSAEGAGAGRDQFRLQALRAETIQTHPKIPMKPETPGGVGPELAHSTSSGPLESICGLQAPSLSRGSWLLVSAGRSGDDQGRALHPTESFRLRTPERWRGSNPQFAPLSLWGSRPARGR
jgi:hypothetical protein